MLSKDKLINQWKKWINRNKTFNKDEIHELETHLIDEIDYLTEKEGLTEQDAFYKAVEGIGEREELDVEFNKVKPIPRRYINWIKVHPWKFVTYFCLFVFIFGFLIGWFPTYTINQNLNNQLGSVKIFKGNFEAFEIIKKESIKVINNPKFAWKNELKYNNEIPTRVNDLITDSFNNLYCSAEYKDADILYCFSPDGKIVWKKENMNVDSIVPTKNGFLVRYSNSLDDIGFLFINKSGKQEWKIKGNFCLMGNDGMLYFYDFIEYKKIEDRHIKIFSCDSKGKIRWINTLPVINNLYWSLVDNCYIDNNSNINIVIEYSGFLNINTNEPIKSRFLDYYYNFIIARYPNNYYFGTLYYLYTVNRFGETIQKRKIVTPIINSENEDTDWINFYKDCFVYCHILNSINNCEFIIYTFDGVEKSRFMESSGYTIEEDHFIIGPDSNFYYYFSDNEKLYFISYNVNGKLRWKIGFKNKIKNFHYIYSPDVFFDEQNNIYFSTGGFLGNLYRNKGQRISILRINVTPTLEKDLKNHYSENELSSKRTIYCITSEGKIRWVMDQPNHNYAFGSELVRSLNRSLYYIENGTNTLYCIQDEEK
jgi:hypothetical protein